jgi:hypothetical protein
LAKQVNLFLTKGYNRASATLVAADGTTIKDLITAEADDSRVIAIAITSSDGTARDILLYINDGTNNFLVGHIDVPANSGFDGTVHSVNGLNPTNLGWLPTDNAGNRYLPLKAGEKFRIAAKSAVSASQTVTVTAIAEDF